MLKYASPALSMLVYLFPKKCCGGAVYVEPVWLEIGKRSFKTGVKNLSQALNTDLSNMYPPQ
jgi:hypothetical protein